MSDPTEIRTTVECRPPSDCRNFYWRHILERSGAMATEQAIVSWLPRKREWRRFGSPEATYSAGWRYLRPAKPHELEDRHA